MKDIKGYEGIYAITSCGKVWGYRSQKFLKPKICKGYLRINLCKNGIKKTYSIHRLVAETYIPNPNNLEEVHHINANKTDNYVGNLQWVTKQDNLAAMYIDQLTKMGYIVITPKGEEIIGGN